MCCSSPRERGRRRGVTLLEVVITMAILAAVMGPLLATFGSSNRLGYSADRMLNATLYAQVALEAITQLEPDELPLPTAGESGESGEVILFDEVSGVLRPDLGGRWSDEVLPFLETPPPFAMERLVLADRRPDGQVTVRVELSWLALPRRPGTRRSIHLEALCRPAAWQ